MPYSTQLCSPTHPANQPTPTPHRCLAAHNKKDYILCATCYKRQQPVVEDDWDDYSPTHRTKGNPRLLKNQGLQGLGAGVTTVPKKV